MRRRTVFIISLLSLIAFTFSCDKDDVLSPNMITLEKDSLSLSSLEQSLKLNVISKTDFEVSYDCEWLSVTNIYSEEESFIEISVKENNDSLQSRNAVITLNSTTNDATAILYVSQACRSIIRLLTRTVDLTSSQQDISIVAQSNCIYDIIIPKESSDWITHASTKATTETNIVLSISKNTTLKRRSTPVYVRNTNDGVQDTLTIIQDEGFQSLRLLLRDNPNATIFYSALVATHLADTFVNYVDDSYPSPSYDSTFLCLQREGRVSVEFETAYQTGYQRQRVVWPDERLFKYTMFIVNDSILKDNYGIKNLAELETFAKEVYNDPAHINDDPKLTTSPLYKLISYHILPFWSNYDELNFTNEEILKDTRYPDKIDLQDFYETMQPYAIMRISTPYDPKAGTDRRNIFINRKGTVSDSLIYKGIKIWNPNEKVGETYHVLNGGYYYIDSLLLFDQQTKDALKTRIRIMGTTLSPDFMNTVPRDRMRTNDQPTTFAVTAFKQGYCRNFSATDQTQFVVRYQDKGWGYYMHDEAMIRGDFDLTLRIPPVPENDTYEIRIFGNALGSNAPVKDRGYVQFYFIEGNGSPVPCGLPVNMGLRLEDSSIGFVKDWELKRDKTEEEGQEAILANDKVMRNRGYMKAPASAVDGSDNNFRDEAGCFRKIICEQYMEAGKDYFLRFKNVDDVEKVLDLCFIEIVPYSIYSGLDGPEDIY